MNRAAENPQRFNLTTEEIASRRKWIATTRRQVEAMSETLKTATAAPTANPVESKVAKANEAFLSGERQQQQLMAK